MVMDYDREFGGSASQQLRYQQNPLTEAHMTKEAYRKALCTLFDWIYVNLSHLNRRFWHSAIALCRVSRRLLGCFLFRLFRRNLLLLEELLLLVLGQLAVAALGGGRLCSRSGNGHD